MGIEQLIKGVMDATPSVRREVEAVLTGRTTTQKNDGQKERRLVTFTATAKLLGVSRSTVYTLVRQGRLDALDLSGDRRISMQSIDDFLAGKRPPNAATEAAQRENAKRYANGANESNGASDAM